MHFFLCDLIADITQNAVEAQAQKIEIHFIQSDTELSVTIIDNGKGMSTNTLKRIQDPFYTDGIKHPNRKIGMGIPFLIQTTEATNGSWNIESKEDIGTTVTMQFDLSNIDTPPIGDVPELFRQILTFSGTFEMIIFRQKTQLPALEYTLIRSEIIEALGGFDTAKNLALLRLYLESQETSEI